MSACVCQAHAHTYTHTHIHAHACVHMYVHKYARMWTHANILAHAQTCTHLCSLAHMCTCMRTHTHTHRCQESDPKFAPPRQITTSHYHSPLGVDVPAWNLTTMWTRDLRRFDNVITGLWVLYQVSFWCGLSVWRG